MDYLKIHDFITSFEAMEVLNLKASHQTRQILREMTERNLLEAQDENRNHYYPISTEKTNFASSSALIGTYRHLSALIGIDSFNRELLILEME